MEQYLMGTYDIIVIGAGHAGCEAGLASARMGKKTLLFSINLESVAMLACNPSIGGTGKGHLVREIDALGGEMGRNIDKTFIQSKMLNTAKGPAVHSLRAQADKHKYSLEMKKTLEKQENLHLKQGEVVDILVEDGKAKGVVLKTGAYYTCDAVIIATGTFLDGKIYIGESVYSSGPNGLAPSVELCKNMKRMGLDLRKFKTGTPARVLGTSINFDNMAEQKGDDKITPFSFMTEEIGKNQVSCYLSYTNDNTHTLIRNNFSRSALFGGQIEGIGPRYCPSIEDKINRFADKERHQLFIEPEDLETDEWYIQGMSSSLPEDVQRDFYKTIPGLENLEIVRPAYAIEYDCINPLTIKMNLESRIIENLFCAGQFNGSSGYEEAAAQGLMAGVNAVLKLNGKEPFVLDRSEAYIGVLIDDLVTKGTEEPYRIMTSRAEYRLVLRQDNADSRLTEKSYNVGLATKERYEKVKAMEETVEKEMTRLENKMLKLEQINPVLEKLGSSPLKQSLSMAEILKRPEVSYEDLKDFETEEMPAYIVSQIEIRLKYSGYIKKQLQQIEKFKKLENKRLPEHFDYNQIEGLRIEAMQKLNQFKPLSVGQASRISGVSPADINVLLVHLEKRRRQKNI